MQKREEKRERKRIRQEKIAKKEVESLGRERIKDDYIVSILDDLRNQIQGTNALWDEVNKATRNI